MSEKIKNLLTRTLSGIVLVAFMLAAMLAWQWSYGVLLLLILVPGMLEFYALAEKRGLAPQKLIGLVSGVVLLLLNFALVSDHVQLLGSMRELYLCALAFMLLITPLMFICELYRKRDNPIGNIATTLLGLFYVAMPLSLLCYLPIIGQQTWAPQITVACLFIIWANDVFAYLVGMSIGRHRLFERLSPKKSWEGFFGGLVGAILIGILAGHLLDASILVWGGLSVVVVVSGVFGDLIESMFKRSAEVKDSGVIIPGHGGVLDRFDALLLSTPFIFVYMLFFM